MKSRGCGGGAPADSQRERSARAGACACGRGLPGLDGACTAPHPANRPSPGWGEPSGRRASRGGATGARREAPREGGAPRGLVEEGTTVTADRLARLDEALDGHREERRRHHEAREEEASRAGERTRADWHHARALALSERWTERARRCGTERHVSGWCGQCGTVHTHAVGCGQRAWCDECGLRATRRMRRRSLRGLGEAVRRERSQWARLGRQRGREPRPVLVTLTVRDTGDLRADRKAISEGWVRLRAWLHRRIGARPFLLCWEVTDGEQGQGHVHAHVVAVWPWVDIHELSSEWEAATEGRAEPQGLDMLPVPLERGVSYVATYATKGAHLRSVSDRTWTEWQRASWRARSYTASRGLLTATDTPSAPSCCASDGGWWAEVGTRRGPPPPKPGEMVDVEKPPPIR